VGGTGTESCSMADFGISGVESLSSTTRASYEYVDRSLTVATQVGSCSAVQLEKFRYIKFNQNLCTWSAAKWESLNPFLRSKLTLKMAVP
jgi:hypothetical protein